MSDQSASDFAKAVREELLHWKLSRDDDGLLLAFCVCIGERLRGRDPADLMKPVKAKPLDDRGAGI